MTTSRPNRRLDLIRVLTLLAAILAPLASSPPARANGDAPLELYRVGDPFYRQVQPLDPLTLADSGQPLSLAADAPRDSSFLLSSDGSTAVTGSFSIEGTTWTHELRVVDTATGVLRATFAVEGRESYVVALSRNGGRAVVTTRTFDKRARLWATNWTVHDTWSGRATSAFSLTHPDGMWLAPYVDDDAEHMWLQSSTVTEPNWGYGPQVGSLVLRHIDLTAGLEVGRLTLGSVQVGTVDRGEVVDQAPVLESVYPAIALAPDGRTLAVVVAETEQVILLDGMTMARIDTLAVHEPRGVAGRLLAWTGILPATAEAKLQVGEWRTVSFSANGRSLYLMGGRGEIDGDTHEDYEAEWLGIRRVDLATGEVKATALDGMQVDQVLSTATGDVYAVGPKRPWTEFAQTAGAMVLYRLDRDTLERRTSRVFDSTVWQVLIVAP